MTQAMIKTAKTDPFPPLRMSFDDFVEWALKNEISAEWVEGEVEYKHVYTDPITGEKYRMVSIEHSALVVFIVILLTIFNDFRDIGRLFGEDCLLRARPDLPGREPDITFVSTGNLRVQISQTMIEGPADLVVEVVSQESIRRDRVTKKSEYRRGGIREYWLVDPIQRETFFYLLDANGEYREAALDADGKFHSRSMPGLWVKPEWFWQNPRLKTPAILREWELV